MAKIMLKFRIELTNEFDSCKIEIPFDSEVISLVLNEDGRSVSISTKFYI